MILLTRWHFNNKRFNASWKQQWNNWRKIMLVTLPSMLGF